MRLNGKVALLSGVGPNMGRATAILYAKEGCSVALVARKEESLQETLSIIEGIGGTAIIIPGDVSKREDSLRIVEETEKRLGGIDILYSGAGGFFDPEREFTDVDDSFWKMALSNTLDGPLNLTQAILPVMKLNGGGSIILVTASFSVRQASNSAYAAAKGGVLSFGQNLSKELYHDNIRVNIIEPGLIRTRVGEKGEDIDPGTKLNRQGHAMDVAHAALYFGSDESSWVTGQILSIDGGVDVRARQL
jgi:NAD(P)-dependent dehydrogenase (short-subunit alcohol dehydrogenase family)